MSHALMWGRIHPWPFRGAFMGAHHGLSWAGRVGADTPLDVAFRAARAVDDALRDPDVAETERRRALSRAWERVMSVPLGAEAPSLAMLLLSEDATGVSVSGIGLGALWAGGQGPARPWLPAEHPLFGPPGAPSSLPGALSVEVAPPWLVAIAHGDDVPELPTDPQALQLGAGVWT